MLGTMRFSRYVDGIAYCTQACCSARNSYKTATANDCALKTAVVPAGLSASFHARVPDILIQLALLIFQAAKQPRTLHALYGRNGGPSRAFPRNSPQFFKVIAKNRARLYIGRLRGRARQRTCEPKLRYSRSCSRPASWAYGEASSSHRYHCPSSPG